VAKREIQERFLRVDSQ